MSFSGRFPPITQSPSSMPSLFSITTSAFTPVLPMSTSLPTNPLLPTLDFTLLAQNSQLSSSFPLLLTPSLVAPPPLLGSTTDLINQITSTGQRFGLTPDQISSFISSNLPSSTSVLQNFSLGQSIANTSSLLHPFPTPVPTIPVTAPPLTLPQQTSVLPSDAVAPSELPLKRKRKRDPESEKKTLQVTRTVEIPTSLLPSSTTKNASAEPPKKQMNAQALAHIARQKAKLQTADEGNERRPSVLEQLIESTDDNENGRSRSSSLPASRQEYKMKPLHNVNDLPDTVGPNDPNRHHPKYQQERDPILSMLEFSVAMMMIQGKFPPCFKSGKQFTDYMSSLIESELNNEEEKEKKEMVESCEQMNGGKAGEGSSQAPAALEG